MGLASHAIRGTVGTAHRLLLRFKPISELLPTAAN